MDAGSLMRMARAPADTAERMHAVLPSLGLETGGERWPAANLHQSLSTDCPARHEPALRRALGRVRAPAFDLVFNRVGLGDRWVLRARGIPDGFARPLAETRAVLQAEGIACDTGHTPHVTLCYAPPFVQDGTRAGFADRVARRRRRTGRGRHPSLPVPDAGATAAGAASRERAVRRSLPQQVF